MNLVLLCEAHHRLIHHGGWSIRMIERLAWFIPPPWLDPDQVPRRNTLANIPG